MPMQSSWVDALFTRLSLRYGRAFMAVYEGLDVTAVKADWADVLHGVDADAMRYALEHLPVDKAPNAMQFRAICRNAPQMAECLAVKYEQPSEEVRARLKALTGRVKRVAV